MPLYEHVFITRPDLSAQQAEGLIETYGNIIRSGGGSVGKTEYWGLRSLAYRIKRYRKGHYSLMNLDAPHEAVAEMERKMRLSGEVVRYLTISVDEHEETPSAVMLSQNERGSRRDDDIAVIDEDMPDDDAGDSGDMPDNGGDMPGGDADTDGDLPGDSDSVPEDSTETEKVQ
ncbi:MAG: 30S ribosomal protein S6 [Hyphomicrobiales bacterium]|nr:30S ribosomal protein S6 [Hyphomicrobiales bacterium]